MTDVTVEVHRDPACDQHAHCPFCGGLMAFNADTGLLVCQDCGMSALDAAEILAKAVTR